VNEALRYIRGVMFIDHDRRLANYLLIEFNEYSRAFILDCINSVEEVPDRFKY